MSTKTLLRNTVKYLACLLLALTGLLLVHPAPAQTPAEGQLAGQVLDQTTRRPLGFVSVGVLRHPFGTVADERGRFLLTLPARYDADSIRFSLLGYASRTVAVGELRRLVAQGPVLLRKQGVPLRPVRVRAPGLRRRVVGNQGGAAMLCDFKANMAGNQLGQRLAVRRPAFLEEASFSLPFCSYDTVYLRLNVYQVRDDFPGPNILPRPIYLRLSREQTASRIYVNLRPYKLYLTEDVIVAVELVRSLGKGTFCFYGAPLSGPCYQLEQTPGPLDGKEVTPDGYLDVPVRSKRQPDNGPWLKYPGVGMGLDATLLELPE